MTVFRSWHKQATKVSSEFNWQLKIKSMHMSNGQKTKTNSSRAQQIDNCITDLFCEFKSQKLHVSALLFAPLLLVSPILGVHGTKTMRSSQNPASHTENHGCYS